jgi:uncharacterized protein YecT (DUF1311 family)
MKKTVWVFTVLTVSLLALASETSKAPKETEQPFPPAIKEAMARCAKAEKELDRAYRKLIPNLTEEKQRQLKTAQRAWIAFRDAEAELEADGAGSGWTISWDESLTLQTEVRTKKLKEFQTWYNGR